MALEVEEILREALLLPPEERKLVAEQLLFSLDGARFEFDDPWAAEVEARIAAYQAGEMDAIPADEVFAEVDRLLESGL